MVCDDVLLANALALQLTAMVGNAVMLAELLALWLSVAV
jgi:hypothetical protein